MDLQQDLCGRYLVSLLAAVLEKKQPEEKPSTLSFEEIFLMAEAHQVSVMALAAVEQLMIQPDTTLLTKWREARRRHLQINIIQILERNRLMKSFSSEGLRVVSLKGSTMKYLYPRTEYRQMGDIDILIEGKDAEKARTMMEEMGYRTEHYNICHHDRYYIGEHLAVELHRTLFFSECASNPYFKDIWERVLHDEKSTGGNRLSHEDFYLFMIAHFEKHFHSFGSGIRSIMDLAVFLDVNGESMNWAYIERELTKLELLEFHETAKRLATAWFHNGSTSDIANQMERDLFSSGGIYGSKQKYLDNIAYRCLKTTKLDYILKRLFLPLQKMRSIYPILKTWPILYPACWLHRLIAKRNVALEEMRYIK